MKMSVALRARVRGGGVLTALSLALVVAMAGVSSAAAAPVGTVAPPSGPTTGGTPVDVTIAAPGWYTRVASEGGYHSLAIAADGSLWSWGRNDYGQLGVGTTVQSSTPTRVNLPGGRGATRVATGAEHSLAIADDGTVWAWGRNNYGALGDGTTNDSSTPVQVQLPTGISFIELASGGQSSSSALASDGSVWSWGGNYSGQLGDGTTVNSSTPVRALIPGGQTVVEIASGFEHVAARTATGTIWSWGRNTEGELGDGTFTSSSTPVAALLPPGVGPARLAAGGYHSLLLASDARVWTWGYNMAGQLGDGTSTNSSVPVAFQTPPGRTVTGVAGGANQSFVLASDGTVWGRGSNSQGMLGNGSTSFASPLTQMQIPAGHVITSIEPGFYSTVVLGGDGIVWATGQNFYGELGDGTNVDSTVPVRVLSPTSTVTGVSIGGVSVPSLSYAAGLDGTGVVSFVTPPHAAGLVDIEVTTTGGPRQVFAQSFTYGAPPVFTSGPPASGTAGQAYSFAVTASGTPVYQVSSGSLPPGITLNGATGMLSGTPSSAGSWNYTITATNTYGSAVQSSTLTVAVGIASGAGTSGGSGGATGAASALRANVVDLAVTGTDETAVTATLVAAGVLLLTGAALAAVSLRRRIRRG